MKSIYFKTIFPDILHEDERITSEEHDSRIDGDFFFLSNDLITVTPKNVMGTPYVMMGTASNHTLMALNAIAPEMDIRSLYFYDRNISQLKFMANYIRDIMISRDRREFLARIFCLKNASKIPDEVLAECLESKCAVHSIYNSRSCALPFIDADRIRTLEHLFWSNVEVDVERFQKRWFLRPRQISNGLLIDSGLCPSVTVFPYAFTPGDEHTARACCLGLGSGFLSSDWDFDLFKQRLRRLRVGFLNVSLEDLVPALPTIAPYQGAVIWTSNILGPFMTKETLDKFANQINSLGQKTDIVIMADERYGYPGLVSPLEPRFRADFDRSKIVLDAHNASFRPMAAEIHGRSCIHVCGADHDPPTRKGISTLYSMPYLTLSEGLERVGSGMKFDTVVLHMLGSYGKTTDQIEDYLQKLSAQVNRLIILEHYSESREFSEEERRRLHKFMPSYYRRLLGHEHRFYYCRGQIAPDRNYVMVYDLRRE